MLHDENADEGKFRLFAEATRSAQRQLAATVMSGSHLLLHLVTHFWPTFSQGCIHIFSFRLFFTISRFRREC